ncbi:phosphoribosyltransferase [Bacillus sp. FJAT-27231]|uniref:ComF family protein n=1 Tax=Bacillus sp. FJAT-27231 TaxID=1679168 RepID=UPI0006718067|nr:ComF family protein [Bacillus sp. FJAT-27231]KMY55515.1 phosphoribosyltransferase [Bacillus sp. FJAT-27231]
MNRCLLCEEETNRALSWHQFFLLEDPAVICEKCRQSFEKIKGEGCRTCSRPLAALDPSFIIEGVCLDCVRWEEDPLYRGTLAKNRSLYVYNDAMKEVIARFKYRGDYVLAKIFAQDIREAAKQIKYDLVIAIPLSEERLSERGFNQAEALAEVAGLEVTSILERIHSEKQSKKSRVERLQAPQVFRIKEKSSFCHKKILILDDIYTTGSTLRQAAHLLKQAGAAEVSALTLARG